MVSQRRLYIILSRFVEFVKEILDEFFGFDLQKEDFEEDSYTFIFVVATISPFRKQDSFYCIKWFYVCLF